MNNINTVSDITPEILADYIRLEEVTEYDLNTLNTLLLVAKDFITNYTGRTAEEIDTYPDIIIVVMILVQDMWDNRAYYVDKTNINAVVDSILHMHSVNLL